MRFREVLPPLHDQVTMLEHKMRLLLDCQAATLGSSLCLLAFATPFLLATSFSPPAHCTSQASQRIQNELVDVLDNMKYAQLMLGFRPQLGQHCWVQVGVVGDHNSRPQLPRLEVVEEPPHVILVVGSNQSESHGYVAEWI